MEVINLMNIKKEVMVEASQQIAFEVFTEKMDLWWPKTHHTGSCPMIESILECRPGGRWFSRHEDGSEQNVGHLRIWEPFGRLVLVWQLNGDFKYDPELISEIEVLFVPKGLNSTLVTLEHRNLEKLMGGTKVVESMDSGWNKIMNSYKNITDAA